MARTSSAQRERPTIAHQGSALMNVIQFDRNNCKRIRAFLDSYLNDELLVETAHEVLRHLADCRDCALLLAERERVKARLQSAVRREVAPEDLPQRIQKSIRQTNRRRWSQWMIGIAATLALAIGTTGALRWWTPPPPSPTLAQAEPMASLAEPSAGLLNLGVGEHIYCALENGYGNRTFSAAEMRAKLGPHFASLVPAVREEIAADFAVMVGHRCRYLGREFVHLILRNPQTTLSLILTRKRGETFTQSDLVAVAEASGIKLYEARMKEMAVAGFEFAGYLAFVVAHAAHAPSLEIALRLAPVVRNVLQRTEG